MQQNTKINVCRVRARACLLMKSRHIKLMETRLGVNTTIYRVEQIYVTSSVTDFSQRFNKSILQNTSSGTVP